MKNSGKGLVKLLIILGVIAVVVVGGLYITFRTGKTVKTAYSAADLKSYSDKTGVVFDENSAGYQDYLSGKYKAIGSKAVKGFLSNAEITAIINKTAAESGAFKNFAVKLNADGTAEMSFVVDKNIEAVYAMLPEAKAFDKFIKMAVGSHVYIKEDLNYMGGDKFEATTLEMKLGVIPLPVDLVNDYATPAGTSVNNIISKMEGLQIDKFELVEGGLNFEGTIPTSVVKTP